MKKILILCLIIILICLIIKFLPIEKITEQLSPFPSSEPTATHVKIITRHKNLEDQKLLWNLLNKYTKNEYISAGILGYFWRESSGKSNSCAGWYINDIIYRTDTCKEFTDKIDAGLLDGSTFEEFLDWSRYHYGGYGLGQWCTINGLTELYNFAQKWGTSIGDAEMQCAFTIYYIKNFRTELWEEILTLKDPALVGYKIGISYDGSPSSAGYIGQLAEQFYNQYALRSEN